MFKWLVSAMAGLAMLASPAMALEPKEAATMLDKMVAELYISNNFACSAIKIGPNKFLTAKHCVLRLGNMSLEFNNDKLWVKSVTVTTEEKSDGRSEDWAILNTTFDNVDMASAKLGCDEELYLGMPIAYMGFPVPTNKAFVVGRVVSLNHTRNTNNDLDYIIDTPAAPGASGSGVISLDTGNIIGILTEGVLSPGIRQFYLTGIEGLASLDLCARPANVVRDAHKSRTNEAFISPF